ncbi:MAG TPA: pyridoxine 5'-phosphate synthase, partial [Alphaproteobacteria bacterium]|nr:pyridoxine 5'-phosphate synthase [Alphaproteobacteria bacterium]
GAGIRVSLFVEAHPVQLAVARALGAQVVELHTGSYCEAAIHGRTSDRDQLLKRLLAGAREASRLGLEVHAGHGLTFDTVGPVAALPELVELNIGHFLVGEAIFGGLDSTIRRMRALMDQARVNASGPLTA